MNSKTKRDDLQSYEQLVCNRYYYDEEKLSLKRVETCRLKYLHSINDVPAIQRFYKNGEISSQCWYNMDVLHRIDEPAIIEYFASYMFATVNVMRKAWYTNGVSRRYGGPCVEEYNRNGTLSEIKWCNMKGEDYTKRIIRWCNSFGIPVDYNKWDDGQSMLFKLTWWDTLFIDEK